MNERSLSLRVQSDQVLEQLLAAGAALSNERALPRHRPLGISFSFAYQSVLQTYVHYEAPVPMAGLERLS
jgi:hypothetical protein